MKVKADIPSTSVSGTSYLRAQVNIEDDITASGQSSGQNVYATAASWPVYGNLMSSGAPQVDVKAGATPAAQTYVKNTNDAYFTSLLLTASTTEDVKVTKIRVSIVATSTDNTTMDLLVGFPASNYMDELISNVKLYDGTTLLKEVTSLSESTNYAYVDFTNLNIVLTKGASKIIDVKAKVLNSTSSDYIYMGVASTSGDVVATGKDSGIAATITNAGNVIGKAMTLGASGSLVINQDPDMPVSSEVLAGQTSVFGKWKFTSAYEDIEIKKLVFDVFHSYTEATGTYGAIVTSYAADSEPTIGGTGLGVETYSFDYATNSGATTTCNFSLSAIAETSTAGVIAALNNPASSTCNADIFADATSSANGIVLYATPAGTTYSLQILDHLDTAASNSADNLLIGLKYGGTESIGARAGANANLSPGKVSLYDGDTLLASASIDASGDGTTTNQVIFNLPSDGYIKVSKNSSKVLTLKAETSDYVGATEGSFIQFAIGTTTATEYQGYYVEAKGSQSQTDIDFNNIADAGLATSGTQYISNAMYIYATKPTVSLNSASPSGTRTPMVNGEVFRFDVANANAGHSLYINNIRFTINSNTTTSVWDKTYKLYKPSDLANEIGKGISWAHTTTSDTVGWVTIWLYTTGNVIASGGSQTYILKADTSLMGVQDTATEIMTVSIEPDDFYFNDGQVANAHKKVLNLPVTGGTLSY